MSEDDLAPCPVHDFADTTERIGLARGFEPLALGLALLGVAVRLILPLWGPAKVKAAIRQLTDGRTRDGARLN